jgi:hypothetical protein
MMATHHAKDGSWIIQARFPRAQEVYLLGAFNNWSTTATRLLPVGEGLFETKVALKDLRSKPATSREAGKHLEAPEAPETPETPECTATLECPSPRDICFFVWEWGQRLGHIVRHESVSDYLAAILPA